MRIIHVISSMGKGGAERYVADLATELATREGIEILVVSMSPVNEYKFLTKDFNFKVTTSKVLPSITGKNVVDAKDYLAIVEAFKPDVIHSHLFHTELLTRHVTSGEIAYVTTCQNNMPEFRNIALQNIFSKLKWAQFYEKQWMLKKYRACQNNFIVISKDTETYFRSVLPKDLQRIELLYHAINFERFNQVNHTRAVGKGKIKLVYVARFTLIKNQSFLIDIAHELKNRGFEVETVLLGDGETRPAITAQVQSLGLEKEVSLPGLVDSVEDYLKDANFYIHPATYEPFGLVIIEAMAAGLPAICLNGKGNKDLIHHGENGFMFDDMNKNTFADKIVELFQNQELYDQISGNAVEYARGFGIERHTDDILALYRQFISDRKGRSV